MKVILNEDVKSLGEEGDVKNVATGYARNYLLPRNLAVPYNEATVLIFEAKKAEIEARKELKRQNSASLKEKLEANPIEIVMPASANGKLFGAVNSHIVADALVKLGFDIERKRIDIPGKNIKSTGNYHASVRLYEAQTAEILIAIKAQTTDGKPVETAAEAPKAEAEEKPAEAEEAPKAE